eukprot:Filipodium_phascolosomae@DN36_c0_g1_i2.p1
MIDATPKTISRLRGRFSNEFYELLESRSQKNLKQYVHKTLAPELAQTFKPTPFYTTTDYFSNFNQEHPWTDDHDVHFLFGEQWLMLGKALLFEDLESAKKIRKCKDPKRIKSIGRQVTPYDDEQWGFQRFNWMVYGLIQKAKHNSDFHEKIMSDSGIFPVEAAPRDVIWGVGVGKEKVGFAIMEARWHLENTITDQT